MSGPQSAVSNASKIDGRNAVPARRSQKERSATTRAALIGAAVSIIGELGWKAATTRLVAARAGVTRGALQHYFVSREDLLKAVASEMFDSLHSRLDTAMLARSPVKDRIRALMQHYYDVYSSPLFRGVLSASLDPDSGVDQYVRNGIIDHQTMIDRTWRDLFSDLSLSANDLRTIRRIVMSALRGYAVQAVWSSNAVWKQDRDLFCQMIEAQLDKTQTKGRAMAR
jgi:AcrR family transcriptional regulator